MFYANNSKPLKNMDSSSTKVKNKKKKKTRVKMELAEIGTVKKEEPESFDEDVGSFSEMDTLTSQSAIDETDEQTRDMSRNQLSELIDKINTVAGESMNINYTKALSTMNWEEMTIEGYTPEECKQNIMRVLAKIRKYRTFKELLTDASDYVANPRNSLAGMPRKPVTTFFIYYKEKLSKFKEKYPHMSNPDLSRKISSSFKQLSPSKKERLQEQYQRDKVLYQQALEKYYQEHPDQVKDRPRRARDHPLKATSASSIYVETKLQEYLQKYPEDESKKAELMKGFRESYLQLSDKKRVKFIKLALKAKEKFLAEEKAYIEKHPKYKPKVTHFITKEEQKLYDRYRGIPDKPPQNGYSLFCQTKMTEFNSGDARKSLIECSQLWSTLDAAIRQTYNKKAEKMHHTYKEKLDAYLNTLTPEERETFELERALKHKKPTSSKSTPTSLSAVVLYQSDKKSKFEKKHPEASPEELKELMAQAFQQLPESKKLKYESQVKSLNESMTTPVEEMPKSAYHLFLKKMKSGVAEGISRKALTEQLNLKWKNMSKTEKAVYQSQLQLMKDGRTRDGSTLDPFTAIKDGGGDRLTQTTATKRKMTENAETEFPKKRKTKLSTKSESSSNSESSSSDSDDDSDDQNHRSRSMTKTDSKETTHKGNSRSNSSSTKFYSCDSSLDTKTAKNNTKQSKLSPQKLNVSILAQSSSKSSSSSSDSSSDDSSDDDSDEEVNNVKSSPTKQKVTSPQNAVKSPQKVVRTSSSNSSRKSSSESSGSSGTDTSDTESD